MNATEPVRRNTRQRAAVLAVLDDLDSFRSAQQIHYELGRRGDAVGLSTVYRSLAALATDGEVDSLLRDDGEAVYRRCSGAAHHHHLVCRSCGATVEVEGPTVERWAEKVAAEHGYDEVSHTLEIFGRCAACR
ncbi:MAG TPA: transcriptional repressor [Candidatus Nanopelagicales bacterium]|nr:transcriptional repressor [Candidatus Nanopelagicales bacterium]